MTPKEVKHRWQQLEKNINKIALSKQMVASMELDMERYSRMKFFYTIFVHRSILNFVAGFINIQTVVFGLVKK
jgi:hypothetical protein